MEHIYNKAVKLVPYQRWNLENVMDDLLETFPVMTYPSVSNSFDSKEQFEERVVKNIEMTIIGEKFENELGLWGKRFNEFMYSISPEDDLVVNSLYINNEAHIVYKNSLFSKTHVIC